MRAELDHTVTHRPGRHPGHRRPGPGRARGADLIHVHMTSAEASAFLARPFDPRPDRGHPALRRRPGFVARRRALARVTARPIVADIAISEFVAASVPRPTTLIHNGVVGRPQAPLDRPVVVMLQRLDQEKAPDIGIRAWAASGLPALGWRLVVAGSGVLVPTSSVWPTDWPAGTASSSPDRWPTPTRCWPVRRSCSARRRRSRSDCRWSRPCPTGWRWWPPAAVAHGETVGEAGILFPPGTWRPRPGP